MSRKEDSMLLTPHQKNLTGWSLTLHKNGGESNDRNTGRSISKGKSVTFLDGQPPPLGFLGENGRNIDDSNEDWMKFREAGFLDKACFEKKDHQALTERVLKLEKELFEYQYNMGLLLLEKQKWTSKYEELMEALAEAQEILKREQVAHLNALSEAEKRAENLRMALGVEKQCVYDLESALRDMRKDSAETKVASDTKMAEAHALVSSIEGKSLEVEAKLHAADAKLAEASRKHAEMERKLKEVEIRESSLRSERQSLSAERELTEATLSKQREELQDWERTLQEREERQIEGRRILNQREERANETDMILKQKQKDLEAAQKNIEITDGTLTKKEEEIIARLSKLAAKEREADDIINSLEVKQKELLVLEERLNVREKVEIQKAVDEHTSILDSKRLEFEVEMDCKRKSMEEEFKSKSTLVEQKEIEINHKDEKLTKREQALEKKLEKLKEKENDLESKSNELKDRETSVQAEEKVLEVVKKEVQSDKENVKGLIAELEKKRVDIENEQLRLHEEEKKLKVTEEERSEHIRLKLELKQEIEKCKAQEEMLLKEHEDLKQDKKNFEREWEVLDEKRAEIAKELNRVNEEKKGFEKFRYSEEENLKTKKLTTESYVRKELEDLRLQKESFEAVMKHEQSMIFEKAHGEREDMLRQFELRKQELELDMQNKRDGFEKQLRARERAFKEEKERDLIAINYSRKVAEREMDELEIERQKIEKEKQNVAADKQHLAKQQLDIEGDIGNLRNLTKKLKDQREQFKKFVEKHESCRNCGEVIGDFILANLQSLQELEESEAHPSPRLPASGRPSGGAATSAGGISWFLRKCKNLSPLKMSKDEAQVAAEELQVDMETSQRLEEIVTAPEALAGSPTGSFDVQRIPGDSEREVQGQHTQSAADNSTREAEGQHMQPSYKHIKNGNLEHPEDSQYSVLKTLQAKAPKKRKVGVKRTRSVKAVVEDAKAIYGEALEQKEEDRQPNGKRESSTHADEGSRDNSSLADKGIATAGRKRSHADTSRSIASEREHDDPDTCSDSVTAGSRRKRRLTGPGLQAPGEKRYNLRRPKLAAPLQLSSKPNKDKEADDSKTRKGELSKSSNIDIAASPGDASISSEGTHAEQVTTQKTTVTEVYEFTSDRIVQFETAVENASGNADAPSLIENIDMSEVNGTAEGTGEYVDEDGYGSEVRGEAVRPGEDEDEEDDELEHPGEASIGKKLWKFFTT